MKVLLVIGLVCVPLMLFVKPIYEYIQENKHHNEKVDNDIFEQHKINTAINERSDTLLSKDD